MTNSETNTQILDLLKQYFKAFPDHRFGQALCNIGVILYDHKGNSTALGHPIDPFYTSNEAVLHNIQDFMNNTTFGKIIKERNPDV